MKMPRVSLRSSLTAAAAVVTMAGGITVATAAPAWAYGKGQIYQIELSANISGKTGGGAWLWFGLTSNGTGDYQGSDCGHGGVGAASDSGPVTWTLEGSDIVIKGAVLNGFNGFPTIVTVPAAYGHYTGKIGSYLTLPPVIPTPTLIGSSELQVAP